jgi:flagellar hook-associated protein 3 FlgL
MIRTPTFGEFRRQSELISQEMDAMGHTQAQVSLQQKIINNSDDPILANQIAATQDFMNQINTYSHNGVLAQSRCSLFNTVMSSAMNAAGDLKLQIQSAQSGVVTDWAPIVNKIQGDLTAMLSAVNTQDSTGQYIFGGMNATVPPYSQMNASYQYQGSMNATSIDIGMNATAIFNESGFDVFGNIPTGNGVYTVNATSTNTGNAYTDAGTVNMASYVADTYTVSFVTNSDGNLAVHVVGAASGEVIPASGQPAPVYTPGATGMNLTFNGVTINVRGQPAAGDSLTVQPSTNQSAFNTIQGLVTALSNPPKNSGQLNQLLSQAGAAFSQIFNHLASYQNQVGVRSSYVDGQTKENTELLNNKQIAMTKLNYLDMTQAMTVYSQQSLMLQATQDSFLKMQQILEDFILQK